MGCYLVAGDAFCDLGVSIPDLELRMHELPSREEEIRVVGPEAAALVDWLRERGRSALQLEAPWHVGSAPMPKWRLWSAHPVLEDGSFAAQPGSALDLGCGTGRNAVFLKANGWKVTAIDRLPDAIERARDLEARYCPDGHPIEWIVGDASSLSTGSSDLVLAIRFFEPWILERLDSLLSPAGQALIEAFTAEHRDATGHPANSEWVWYPEQLRALPGFKPVVLGDDGRMTQVLFART